MPDERSFKINIVSEFDASGTRATVSQLDKVAASTKETAKESNFLGNAHRDLHRIMHQLTEESPLLAAGLRTIFSPTGGALTAAIGVISLVKEHISELNKSMDEMEKISSSSIGNMTAAFWEMIGTVTKAREEYSNWVKTMTEQRDSATTVLDDELAKMKEIEEAAKRMALAELEMKRGGMTDEEYTRRKVGIETSSASHLSAQELAAIQKAFADVNAQLPGAAAASDAAAAAATDSKRVKRLAYLPGAATSAEEDAKAAQPLLEKIRKEYEEHYNYVNEKTGGGKDMSRVSPGDVKLLDELKEEFETYQRLVSQNLELAKKYRLEQHDLTLEQDRAAKTAETAKKKFDDLDTEFQKLSRQLDQSQFHQGVTSANNLSQRMEAAAKLSLDAQRKNAEVVSKFHDENLKLTVKLTQKTLDATAELERLNREVDRQGGQIKNSFNP